VNREELFEKYLRRELTPAQTGELKRLLATDPEAGRAFVEYSNETTLLVRVGSQLQSSWPADNIVPLPTSEHAAEFKPTVKARGRLWKVAALAACLVAVAVTAALLMRETAPRAVPDVYVSGEGVRIERNGVRLAGEDVEVLAGDVISTATNQLATIVYEHELTRVTLQPGTVLVFGGATHGKQFELRRGTIEARVAPQPAGQPLSVATAHGFATVLGTEFVMRTDERATKLDVLEGKVRLACRVTGRTVKVKAGYAAMLNNKAPFNLAPLCKTNCILRERRDTNAVFMTAKPRKNE
jgi:ferric-dicitrate binding protein FerR (iron transport regulator)